MNAPDPITTFFPCDGEEYELRTKLHRFRNVAAAMIQTTESGTARKLAWIASDYVTALHLAPLDLEQLRELKEFTRRVMLVAMDAQTLDDQGICA